MTASNTPEKDSETAEEFRDALETLVRRAYENGVEIEGGWALRGVDDRPDWGIEIYAVVGRPDEMMSDDRASSGE